MSKVTRAPEPALEVPEVTVPVEEVAQDVDHEATSVDDAELESSASLDKPTDTVALSSSFVRIEQVRALREVSHEEVSGEPAFEPRTIQRFLDTDGRLMAVVVSYGELCKTEVTKED